MDPEPLSELRRAPDASPGPRGPFRRSGRRRLEDRPRRRAPTPVRRAVRSAGLAVPLRGRRPAAGLRRAERGWRGAASGFPIGRRRASRRARPSLGRPRSDRAADRSRGRKADRPGDAGSLWSEGRSLRDRIGGFAPREPGGGGGARGRPHRRGRAGALSREDSRGSRPPVSGGTDARRRHRRTALRLGKSIGVRGTGPVRPPRELRRADERFAGRRSDPVRSPPLRDRRAGNGALASHASRPAGGSARHRGPGGSRASTSDLRPGRRLSGAARELAGGRRPRSRRRAIPGRRSSARRSFRRGR